MASEIEKNKDIINRNENIDNVKQYFNYHFQ